LTRDVVQVPGCVVSGERSDHGVVESLPWGSALTRDVVQVPGCVMSGVRRVGGAF
jgi:hypothetical protein